MIKTQLGKLYSKTASEIVETEMTLIVQIKWSRRTQGKPAGCAHNKTERGKIIIKFSSEVSMCERPSDFLYYHSPFACEAVPKSH